VFQTRVLREIDTAAQDYACFTNDLHSYQKEIEFEGEVHNLVLVVENFFDVDRLTARDVVADLMAERMRQFEHLVADDLPALYDELDLGTEARGALTRYAEGLKDWMSGILEWHRKCARYQEAELVRHHRGEDALSEPETPAVRPALPHLPTGLGTSAVTALRPAVSPAQAAS
jgi:germacradienol/geosmin synthase